MVQVDKRIAEWQSSLEAEREELAKRREELDAQLQRVSQKLELLRQMRSLKRVGGPGDASGDGTL